MFFPEIRVFGYHLGGRLSWSLSSLMGRFAYLLCTGVITVSFAHQIWGYLVKDNFLALLRRIKFKPYQM